MELLNKMNEKNINGLKNLGNTCYINSVLQCLNYTMDMTEYFISDNYLKDIKNKEKESIILTSYINLIKGLSKLDKTIAPVTFVKNFKTIHKYSFEQQDSHEALITLIDDIHRGINREVKMKIIDDEKENLSKISWKNFFEKDYSEIINIFYGQFYSHIKCSCSYISPNYEPFCCISCEIPNFNNMIEMKLDDCLESFFLDEELNTDYSCTKCKKNDKLIKKLSINRLPNNLIIHLKRFITLEDGNSIKNNRRISFPIYLSLSNYVDSIISKKDTIYHLYAIINHIGTISSGHFYSYCQTESGKWSCFNDDDVDDIEKGELKKNNNAYILFYKKI